MPDLTQDPNASSTLTASNDTTTDTQTQTTNFQTDPDASVSANAPVTDSTPTSIDVQAIGRKDWIEANCLDDYMDVTYGISLAMVQLSAVQSFGQSSELGSEALNISSDQYIVFASTGESDTNPSAPLDYYNIQAMSFSNFLAHYPQNPMVAFIWDGKMRLFEPHGFSFREDIEAMRKQMGYDAVPPWNFTYRMEIWFSGWNPQTGQWTRKIPIPINNSRSVDSIVYFLTITTMEAEVTPNGTSYELSFQMYSHKTLRHDALIYRAESQTVGNNGSVGAETGGTNAPQSNAVQFGPDNNGPATFRGFLQNLVVALKQQVSRDTEGHLNFIYNMYAPEWLLNERFDQSGHANIAHGTVTPDNNSGINTYASQDVDILTLISKVMENLPVVRKLSVRKEDKSFVKPRVWWHIRTNLQYLGDFSYPISGYQTYTLEYFIEPVLSYRSGKTEVADRNTQATYSAQLQRARAMADDYGMLLRIYDFMFTNNNSEVLNFEYKFKYFYQEAYPNTGSHTLPAVGQQGRDIDVETQKADDQKEQAQEDQSTGGPNFDFNASSDSSLETLLGISSAPQSADNTTSPAYVFHDLTRGPDLPATRNLPTQEATVEMKLYQRAKDQYSRYDMINVNMTVRFDPLWLINPYIAGGDYSPSINDGTGKTLNINMDRIIFVRAYAPVQSDFMNPQRQSGSSRQTPILSGFYQVLKVVNTFDGGKFTQNLNMFKYPHMNGFLGPTSSGSGIAQGTNTSAQPASPNPTSGEADPNTSDGLNVPTS